MRMPEAKSLLIAVPALIIASAAPAIAFGGFAFFTFGFCIVLVVGLLAGLPAYAVLRASGKANWASAAASGFLIAGVPPLLMTLSFTPDSASTGNVATVVNGARTLAGWMEALLFIGSLGGSGAVAGLIFWFIVKPGGLGAKVAWPFACLIGALAVAQPILTFDRSCHNTMRDGRDSIAPEATLELHVGPADWPALEKILRGLRQRTWLVDPV